MLRIYSLCPGYDLSAIGLAGTESVLAAAYPDPALCEPYFNQYDCVKDLGFPAIGTLTYTTEIPSSTGTLTPSVTAATATTPPVAGSTYVMTAGGISTTITLQSEGSGGSISVTGAGTGTARVTSMTGTASQVGISSQSLGTSPVPAAATATSSGGASMSTIYDVHRLLYLVMVYLAILKF